MAENLSEEKIEEFRSTFDLFDKEKKGKIKSKELGIVIRKLGQNPTDTELLEMIDEIDTDKNGTIEFTEFLGLMDRLMKDVESKESLIQTFKVIDKDLTGSISTGELRDVLLDLNYEISNDELNEIINYVDTNGDGQLDYDELLNILYYN